MPPVILISEKSLTNPYFDAEPENISPSNFKRLSRKNHIRGGNQHNNPWDYRVHYRVGPTPRARSASIETSLRVNLELHLTIAGGP